MKPPLILTVCDGSWTRNPMHLEGDEQLGCGTWNEQGRHYRFGDISRRLMLGDYAGWFGPDGWYNHGNYPNSQGR